MLKKVLVLILFVLPLVLLSACDKEEKFKVYNPVDVVYYYGDFRFDRPYILSLSLIIVRKLFNSTVFMFQ